MVSLMRKNPFALMLPVGVENVEHVQVNCVDTFVVIDRNEPFSDHNERGV